MLKKIVLPVLFASLLGGCTVPFLSPKQAALQINASPEASVYLNDNHVGKTPYFDDKLKPGEYTVKVVLDNDPNKQWQTQVTLTPQIVTVLNRNFGDTTEESSNYLLQLEPLASKTTSEISIVTIPDNVIVRLDGQPKGFSPLVVDEIAPGDHNIVLAAPGYKEQTIQAKVKEGYKLVVSAQLAKTTLNLVESPQSSPSAQLQTSPETPPSSTPSPSPSPASSPTSRSSGRTATSSATPELPYVEITETGTGWLRVRSAPNSTADNEVAKVDVGTKLPWVEANDTGWYKIEYAPGKAGWISGRYATLYR